MVLMVSNHHTVKIKTLTPPGAEIFSKTGARIKVYYIENTLSLTLWKDMLSTASIWLIHGFMVLMVSNYHTVKINTLTSPGAEISS